MSRLRVLLVEDDPALSATLAHALELNGYAVERADRRERAEQVFDGRSRSTTELPDIVLLDLGLPDGDGAELIHWIRGQAEIPVIVISARYDDAGKVRLLDAGADDYLVKPFSINELLARIRVLFRQRGRRADSGFTEYRNGPLEVSVERHAVNLDGRRVRLTPTEFKLLARLVRQAGQVVTHRQLLGDVWGPDHVTDTHYLRLYMAQLRGKLENNPAEPCILLTEPGVGYRLAEPGTAGAER
jgi:two-component system KDP operon response regulator KdpE